MQDDAVVCQWADELKEKLGVRRIIGVSVPLIVIVESVGLLNEQGHTPNFQKVVDRCNGSIIIIDTGRLSASHRR